MHHHLRILAAAAALVAGAAQAQTLYGTQYGGTTPLYTLDQATGALTAGPSTGKAGIGDLASSGTGSTVWGVQIATNTLHEFDAATGATVRSVAITGSVNPAGGADNIVSIAYDAATGTMYGNGSAAFGGAADLFRIDLTTGAASFIGNLQVDPMYALAFNPADGFLYGADGEFGNPSRLWKISTANAAASFIGDLASTGNFDLAFRPGDNALFMASSGAAALYKVNPFDASSVKVGDYGAADNIAGLAFANPVPEPSTYALMALGLAVVGAVSRRRRGGSAGPAA